MHPDWGVGSVGTRAGQDAGEPQLTGGRRHQRDVLAWFDAADLQQERFRQLIYRAHPGNVGRRRWQCPRRRCQGNHHTPSAADYRHPIRGELRVGDQHVGVPQCGAEQSALPGGPEPARGPRDVEHRHVVHCGDGHRTGGQWQVHVQAVHQVGTAHRQHAQRGPGDAGRHRTNVRAHSGGQLAHRVTLHHRAELGIGATRYQGLHDLAGVGLDPAAAGAERKRVESDTCWVTAHPTTPKSSQK